MDDEVAGHEAISVLVFADKKLTSGLYGIDCRGEDEETVYRELIEKCTSIYGEPDYEKSGNKGYTLWIDSDNDFICVRNSCSIIYGEQNTVFLDLMDLLIGFDGNELRRQIERLVNTDGI